MDEIKAESTRSPARYTGTGTPAQIARAIAHEIRTDNSVWTTGVLARNSLKQPTRSSDPGSTCWCAYGFCEREFGNSFERADLIDAMQDVIQRRYKSLTSIGHYNDDVGRTAEEIASLFDDAAKILEVA